MTGGVELGGIRAENPLGLLAVLGALSLASDAHGPDVTLEWVGTQRSWKPVMRGIEPATEDSLVEAIGDAHDARDLDREFGWTKDLMKLSRDAVRDLVAARMEDGGRALQIVAACVSELPLRRDDLCSYTPLRVMPRVGRARFVQSAWALSTPEAGLPELLRTALFGPWEYHRPVNSLRWDPGAGMQSRAYAAEAPTHTRPAGVPGAMLLAVRGLVFFPLMPSRGIARAPGVDSERGLVWPIWTGALDEAGVRMLFALPDLYQREPDGAALHRLRRHGVVKRMQAARTRLGDDDEVFSWGEPW